jgi:hypothetical protein
MLLTGYNDASALANERIENLRREAEEQRLVRASREDADQGSPRRPRR